MLFIFKMSLFLGMKANLIYHHSAKKKQQLTFFYFSHSLNQSTLCHLVRQHSLFLCMQLVCGWNVEAGTFSAYNSLLICLAHNLSQEMNKSEILKLMMRAKWIFIFLSHKNCLSWINLRNTVHALHTGTLCHWYILLPLPKNGAGTKWQNIKHLMVITRTHWSRIKEEFYK